MLKNAFIATLALTISVSGTLKDLCSNHHQCEGKPQQEPIYIEKW